MPGYAPNTVTAESWWVPDTLDDGSKNPSPDAGKYGVVIIIRDSEGEVRATADLLPSQAAELAALLRDLAEDPTLGKVSPHASWQQTSL